MKKLFYGSAIIYAAFLCSCNNSGDSNSTVRTDSSSTTTVNSTSPKKMSAPDHGNSAPINSMDTIDANQKSHHTSVDSRMNSNTKMRGDMGMDSGMNSEKKMARSRMRDSLK